jgi:hypothetical protein
MVEEAIRGREAVVPCPFFSRSSYTCRFESADEHRPIVRVARGGGRSVEGSNVKVQLWLKVVSRGRALDKVFVWYREICCAGWPSPMCKTGSGMRGDSSVLWYQLSGCRQSVLAVAVSFHLHMTYPWTAPTFVGRAFECEQAQDNTINNQLPPLKPNNLLQSPYTIHHRHRSCLSSPATPSSS